MVCAFVFNSTPCDDRSLDPGHREDEQTEKTRKRAFTNGEGGAGKARGAGTLEITRQLNFSKKDEELLKFLVFFSFSVPIKILYIRQKLWYNDRRKAVDS